MAKGGRPSGGATGGVSPGDILSTTSLMSARETQRAEVDDVMKAFDDVFDEYGAVVNDIQLAKLSSSSKAMAYYDSAGNVAINDKYFDVKGMNAAYDNGVKSGFHPSRGNKTGLQAVAAHELGHKLTHDVATKMGYNGWDGLDKAADIVMVRATKKLGGKNISKKISGYANKNSAEALAEAFADVYCNGRKASKESRTVVGFMNSYLKRK